MRRINCSCLTVIVLSAQCLFVGAALAAGETIRGERLDPDLCGPVVIETMAEMIARDRAAPPRQANPKARNGRQGVWVVPSRRATYYPHSGNHNVVNKWGDTKMGISFAVPVDVRGAYFSGQAARGAWASGIQVVGYHQDKEVGKTDWFRNISDEPAWLAMNLRGVDRIVIICAASIEGAGWYGMDDLTFSTHVAAGDNEPEVTVLDFEDLSYRTTLTGSGYAGLTWETGTGDFKDTEGVPAPRRPEGIEPEQADADEEAGQPRGNGGTLPELMMDFQGVIRGDAGSSTYPPDTDGAVGPNHYVETVNRNFAVYDKTTGAELTNIHLQSFLPGSNGDPRTLFDQHSGRWVVIVSDFSTRIFLAVSYTDDPMGTWFKTNIVVSTGSDSGRFPDYPTLGVDANGIYTAAYMVGGGGMSIFAIDKAPLVDSPPSMGTVTAFRNLPWEGAIQPAHTYGTPPGEYLVSRSGSTTLRVRRINPPLSSPTLTELGFVSVPSNGNPPDAPAQGSGTPLDTVDARPMMSLYRDGSLWTTHCISVSGRAGCRWYEIAPESTSLIQYGTVSDPVLYYFFPSIMVNEAGHVVMGFSGSSSSQYAGAYYTGRRANDPAGEMGPPVQFRAGSAAQNNIDGYGRNRWGDYSYTTLDPVDRSTFWTIQEYAHANNIWGTRIAVLGHGDCDGNGIPDECDLDCGLPGGQCDVPGCGQSFDCNGDNQPDQCGDDCNGNGLADECDLAEGTSQDCDGNNIPDECDPDCDGDNTPDACEVVPDCNGNGIPDDCDIAGATSPDCNTNGVPDECDLGGATSADCNGNGTPDECDIASGTSADCNGNGVPDACDMSGGTSRDCNGNVTPDECDIAAGTSSDCNGNNVPDQCDMNPVITADSGQLSPFRYGSPQTFVVISPPPSLGNVTLDFETVSDLNWVNEFVDVDINGTPIGTLWVDDGQQCPGTPDTATIVMTANDYNDAVGGGNADIGMVPSVGMNFMCPVEYITVSLEYLGNNPADCNLNGTPDECETDCNLNGVPDDCDIAAGTSQDLDGNGIPDECEGPGGDGDCDGDGDVDLQDFVVFAGCFTGSGGGPLAPECECADLDGDNDVDLADFVAFSGNFTGSQ